LRQQIARQKAEIQEHQEMIDRDLKLAAQVQRSLVPKPIHDERFEVAIKYLPMIGVGGDFSDIFYDQEDELYLTIVDVTGHGITAALLVNRICMEIRRLVREKLEPARILHQLNGFIYDSFKGTGMFLTMFTGALRLSTGELRYAGSAHPAAILWRSKVQRFELLESQNPIIGFEKTGAERFTQNQTIIQPGDKFLLYTDGIIEIEDKQKTPLGIKGLLQLLHPAMDMDSHEAIGSIMNGLKRYIHEAQRDDIYLIITALR
jgi:sigma-B regulation protein RsbU (phosphoserine phosphatase)